MHCLTLSVRFARGGQVIQGHGPGQNCWNPFGDLSGGKLACIDTGQRAWGACAEKVKLPSSEFDYDPQSLAGVLDMSVSTLLSSHPGCGTMPLAIRSNRAGRYGMLMYLYVCICMHACMYVQYVMIHKPAIMLGVSMTQQESVLSTQV